MEDSRKIFLKIFEENLKYSQKSQFNKMESEMIINNQKSPLNSRKSKSKIVLKNFLKICLIFKDFLKIQRILKESKISLSQ